MKMQYLVLSFMFVIAGICAANAQKATNSFIKKESIRVQGECSMCKKKIENAALSAGAANAYWDENSKMLSVSYDRYKTNTASIETAVAAAGYDTKDKLATNEAYNKLPECCQYTRSTAAVKCCNNEMACSKDTNCCAGEKCDPASKMCADMSTCKEKGCCKS